MHSIYRTESFCLAATFIFQVYLEDCMMDFFESKLHQRSAQPVHGVVVSSIAAVPSGSSNSSTVPSVDTSISKQSIAVVIPSNI